VQVKPDHFVQVSSYVLRSQPSRPVSDRDLDFSRQLVGVEQPARTNTEAVVRDLAHAVPGSVIAEQLNRMAVNLLIIPVSGVDQEPLLRFASDLREAGSDSAIVLSAVDADTWAAEVAAAYLALADAGLTSLVRGCQLRELPSSDGDWGAHIERVTEHMGRLNAATESAFASRSLLLPGPGKSFRGAVAAFRDEQLESKLYAHCASFVFTFNTATVHARDIENWESYFQSRVGLAEFATLGEPMLYVGDNGGFNPKPPTDSQWGQKHVALRRLFRRNGWSHFAFGPLLFRPCQCAAGRSVLYKPASGKMQVRTEPLANWNAWKTGVTTDEPPPNPNKEHTP
jgi:hypothetical protein